jgi:carbon monoxide dehydrogenase subunit G
MELHVSREVAAPCARVWEIVTDLDAAPSVLSGVEELERLDGGEGFGVGTRWRETRMVFGKRATEEMEVTAVEPSDHYTVVAHHGSTTYTSGVSVASIGDDRCRVGMSFHAATSGVVGRVLGATLGRLFVGATRKGLQRDLDDIAAHAEAAP